MANYKQPYTFLSGFTVLGGPVKYKITTHIELPSGDTAQRDPLAGVSGFRFNKDTDRPEIKTSTGWQELLTADDVDNVNNIDDLALVYALVFAE